MVSEFSTLLFGPAGGTHSRHVRRIDIDLETFVRIFTPGDPYLWMHCESGLPEGARLIAAAYDPIMNRLSLLAEHESFEPAPPGAVVEAITVTYRSLWHGGLEARDG